MQNDSFQSLHVSGNLNKDQQGQLYRVLLDKHNIMECVLMIWSVKSHWSRKIDVLMERRREKDRHGESDITFCGWCMGKLKI